jgi:hypothetical protein
MQATGRTTALGTSSTSSSMTLSIVPIGLAFLAFVAPAGKKCLLPDVFDAAFVAEMTFYSNTGTASVQGEL